MSTAVDVVIPIVTALCGGGAMKGLEWWGRQKSEARAAAAAAAEREAARKAAADHDASAEAKSAQEQLIAFVRAQQDASEKRGEAAAERAVAIAGALQASATSQTELARAVDRIPEGLAEIVAILHEHSRILDALTRQTASPSTHPTALPTTTGEHRTGSGGAT